MKTVDVVIPVHNSAHWLAWCLEELFRFKFERLQSVFVVDDHSEGDQLSRIKQIVARFPEVNFIENDGDEKGFGYTCGLGAAKSSADIILFLNTDCLVTEGVIDRLAEAFEKDSEVALACPLSNNSSNITYPMLPGYSYRDMARLLSKATDNSENDYIVEACTIVGNCLMVARSFFEEAGGFAAEWGVGYGEETDLHMKALASGLKGVVHTGCYVYHYGGGTFNYELEIEAHRTKNYQLFMSKWAEEYNSLALRCENLNPVRIVNKNLQHYFEKTDKVVELDALFYLLSWARHYVQYKSLDNSANPLSIINKKLEQFWEKENKTVELDVLFYLPGIDQGVGGVNAVVAICNDLIRRGLKAGVALIGASDFQLDQYRETVLFNFLNFDSNEAFLQDTTILPKVVFSTIIWSGPIVAKFAADRNAVAAQFVQGYEAFFWNGTRYIEAVESYRSTDYLVTTSNWLRNMVKRHILPEQRIDQLPLVVNKDIFFPSNLPRTIDVILVLRASTDKGQWILIELLDRLVAANKSVTVFCATDYLPLKTRYEERVNFISLPVEQYALAQTMRRAKLFIDASLHEGYGLLPLEAALCGCSLLLSDSGGINDFIQNYNAELIPNLLDLESVMTSVNRMLDNFEENFKNDTTQDEMYTGIKWQKYLHDITENLPPPFFNPELINLPDNPEVIPASFEEEIFEAENFDEFPPAETILVEENVAEISPEELENQSESIPENDNDLTDFSEQLSEPFDKEFESEFLVIENGVDGLKDADTSNEDPVADKFYVKTYRLIVPGRVRRAIKILLGKE